MELKELRNRSGMSQKEFSIYFDIPERTIQHWEAGTRLCPKYLFQLIIYKLEKEGLLKN